MDNQNAAVPGTLRTFLKQFVDRAQAPQLFLGINSSVTIVRGSSPLDQVQRQRRYWDYLGVRYFLTSLYTDPERSRAEEELFGYGLADLRGSYRELAAGPEGVSVPLDCARGAVVAVRVRISTFGRQPAGVLALRVAGEGVAPFTTEVAAKYISDQQYIVLPTGDRPCRDPGDKVTLNFRHAGATPGNPLGILYGDDGKVAVDLVLSSEDRSSMRLREVFPRLGILLFENLSALPRSYFTSHYETVADWRSAQAAFGRLADLRSVAYGEESSPKCAVGASPAAAEPAGQTSIGAVAANTISLEANVSAPGVLVLTDTFAPGWTASVNGARAAVLRINGTFRGICLPAAGAYRIAMRYRPPLWDLSLAVAGAGLLGWAALLTRRFARHRWRPAKERAARATHAGSGGWEHLQ
jgi:hypothetical protein